MADKNFARSGIADTDLLADDDPLSELARIVGFDPRPVTPEQRPASLGMRVVEPVQVPQQRQEPAFGLEDELMREFELYDAPPRLDPVDHISRPPSPEEDASQAASNETGGWNVVSGPEDFGVGQDTAYAELEISSEEIAVEESFAPDDSFAQQDDAGFAAEANVGDAIDSQYASQVFEHAREVSAYEAQGDYTVYAHTVDVSPAESDYRDEPHLANSAYEAQAGFESAAEAAEYEVSDSAHAFSPEESASNEIPAEPVQDSVPHEPVYLGLQPTRAEDDPLEFETIDLEKELELSIGDALKIDGDEPEAYAPIAEEAEEPVHLGLHPATLPEPIEQAMPSYVPEIEAEASVEANLAYQPVSDEPAAGGELDYVARWNQPEPVALEASFAEPQAVAATVAEVNVEPEFGTWMHHHYADQGDAAEEPFHAEQGYAGSETHLVTEPVANDALARAEREMAWQSEAVAEEHAFHSEEAYAVAPVAPAADGYQIDDLLAEVERFPMPELRPSSVLPSAVVPSRQSAQVDHGSAPIFTRATPFVRSQAPVSREVVAPAVAVAAPVAAVVEPIAAVAEPVAIAAAPVARVIEAPAPVVEVAAVQPSAEVKPDTGTDGGFDNFELDLSEMDLDLDLGDFSLNDEKPVAAPVAEVAKRPEPAVARPVEQVPVRAAQTVVPPVATYVAPVAEPVAEEDDTSGADSTDNALPFDPSMIADTEYSVSPVTELDVPQLPPVEKEKPAAYQPDYDLDLDAEMAQLFAEPSAAKTAAAVAVGAAAASAGYPAAESSAAADGDADDFEKALQEDFRRSLTQAERTAIQVDPLQGDEEYDDVGYDEPRRGKGMLIAASIALVVALGGGGVYAWMWSTGDVGPGSGEPRVILADKEPVKIVPEEKGGKTVPNQDKAVYDRVAGTADATPKQEKLVTTTEEPVDVVQRTLTPETLPNDSEDDVASVIGNAEEDSRLLPGVDETGTAKEQEGKAPVVSPRKVRTMIVKPDGTLVAREETVSEAETASAATSGEAGQDTIGNATKSALAAPSGALPTAEAGEAALPSSTPLRAGEKQEAGTEGALQEVAKANVEDSAPVRVVKTTTFGNGNTGGNTPVPGAKPVEAKAEQATPVATPEMTASQPAEKPAEQVQVAAANPGGYVIQIASLPSEAEAQKSYGSLSSKFSDVIGGRGVDIKKAEIPNKGTYYRVRIPAGSREEANALCSKYKSAGGSCIVTK
ncbi:SPOR domain-containing protein [Sinorhizobium sp. BG8]|uniref:SPOR domain-containing protein n=1 Tax=Sinorhizobium sp. BG8 TaxID=2613773 RepID=UPI00193D40CB|nr:SPOR domain-containing protein [Sinorhizobium sp. BG8]QRM55362.1 SPOR domain-containing protein [Sinorhizobium sp. BG8]